MFACNKLIKKHKSLLKQIKKHKYILLFTHMNPDGDAMGSMLAMYHVIKHYNKNVFPIILDNPSHDIDFLPGLDSCCLITNISSLNIDLNECLGIALDAADKNRLGIALSTFFACKTRAQFDHHITNDSYADINFVRPSSCSTALLVYEFIKSIKFDISKDIAICLYTGLSTDTGNFAFSNADSDCFAAMADIRKTDFPIQDYNYILFRRNQVPQLKITARAVSTLSLFCNNMAAYMYITKQDLIECAARNEHTTKIVNEIINIEGIKVAFFIHETIDGQIRCSLRSKDGYYVDVIAKQFGGGGHQYAAGCSLDYNIMEGIKHLIQAVEDEIYSKQ